MNKVTSTITYGNNATNLDDWQKNSHPWTVELRYRRRRMTVNFWTGCAAGEPTTYTVLNCLIMDAHSIEWARDFTDWANDYGYDPDSRKAESLYNAVIKQTNKLKKLLGDDYEKFASCDEESIGKMAA